MSMQHMKRIPRLGGSADGRGPRSIGGLLQEACALSDHQIEQIVAHQRRCGLRFGEAAVALRLVDRNDVVHALSRQFEYAFAFDGDEDKAPSELVAAEDPFGDQAEAFRELRSRLQLEVLDERRRCALAVVSPEVGDGKSYLSANLAVALSQLGERTLLIDADLRAPRQHQLIGVWARAGLSSVLGGFAGANEALYPVPGLPSLFVLPAGAVPPNPLELLQRPAFEELIREMLERFEHVVIDTSAAARGADSRVVAARSGAAIVVARWGRSRMAALEGLVGSIARGPAKIAGVVMNAH
jgi:chain length determinant protein tyrosine kinase EpsG